MDSGGEGATHVGAVGFVSEGWLLLDSGSHMIMVRPQEGSTLAVYQRLAK